MIGCVTATDDFQGQEAVDLAFSKGEVIVIQKLVDENWGEGQIGNERHGMSKFTLSSPGLGNLSIRIRLRDRFTSSNLDRQLDRDIQDRISDRKAEKILRRERGS